jgi:hypothetical protein
MIKPDGMIARGNCHLRIPSPASENPARANRLSFRLRDYLQTSGVNPSVETISHVHAANRCGAVLESTIGKCRPRACSRWAPVGPPVRSTHSYGFTVAPIQFDSAREPQSIAYHGGGRPSNPGEVRPLLLRFRGSASFEQPDKFREVGCGYIRHSPELESTM